MNPSVRRATPDSEALASSEDERPWPTAPSFGSFPHKESSVPGLGTGIWATQKRGSFKMDKGARENAVRGLAAPAQPRSGLRNDTTPSPSASEGSTAFPFRIPSHPAPKAGRSMSHSTGQREPPPVSGALANQPDHAPSLPLGLLAEEVDTESESEIGAGLTHTTSHPPIGSLHRTATYPATYDAYYGGLNGKDQGEVLAAGAQRSSRPDRRLDASFANLSLASEQAQRRAQWQTHLGWDDVPNINESRRHSLADIPTRRGSLAGGTAGHIWANKDIYDLNGGANAYDEHDYREPAQLLDYTAVAGGGGRDEEDMLSAHFAERFKVPDTYKLNQIELPDNERAGKDQRLQSTMARNNMGLYPGSNTRPRKILYIVSFKCSRVDCFYLLDNTGLLIKEGDIVIVEADRGQDLGTVQHANVTPDEARHFKRRYGEEQYKWLMMFSKNNNQSSVNPNAQLYGQQYAGGVGGGGFAGGNANLPTTMRDNYNNLKPKAIKRLANVHEIRMLADKEGNEAKAKRTCQQKVNNLHLEMEILDAEWQWDFQKLIFYFYADHYINFKDLITELYRIYKTRIWLSAINPASFSQHAHGQPPSGIGPGAITGGVTAGADGHGAYAQAYGGADPDPYGAVPPYHIGYDTYTPNYPAIPGIANSFAGTQAGYMPSPPPPPGAVPVPYAQGYGAAPGYNAAAFNNQPFLPGRPSGTRPGAHTPTFPPPAPIGTRPYQLRNGPVSTTEDTPPHIRGMVPHRSQWPSHLANTTNASEFVPAPSTNASNAKEFVPGMGQWPQVPTFGASFGGGSPLQARFGSRSEEAGKAEVMQSYLDSLRADEMSRER